MTARGIDQVLPHPADPRLHEYYVRSALRYVELAEKVNGPIPAPVDFAYVWGDALAELERVGPDARIVNLETAVTTSDTYVPKGINYRMSPANIDVLTVAGIDCAVLANNHVLDWGEAGLSETLATLASAGIRTAGAGESWEAASAPAIVNVGAKGRVLVFSYGTESSGIASDWGATESRAGVARVEHLSPTSVRRVAEDVGKIKRPGDIVVASLHWGGNWGYEIPQEHRSFAHGLIERAGVDVVHGHSSHHVMGIEAYQDRLILYGCGDFINDYEGIQGHESYRDDLGLMYFPCVDRGSGRLQALDMTPTRLERFQVHLASNQEARWLEDVLNREGRPLGTAVVRHTDNRLRLRW